MARLRRGGEVLAHLRRGVEVLAQIALQQPRQRPANRDNNIIITCRIMHQQVDCGVRLTRLDYEIVVGMVNTLQPNHPSLS